MWDPVYNVEAILRIISVSRPTNIRIVGILEQAAVRKLTRALAEDSSLNVVVNRSINVTEWSDLVIVMPDFTAPVCSGGTITRERIDWITVIGYERANHSVWHYRHVSALNSQRAPESESGG